MSGGMTQRSAPVAIPSSLTATATRWNGNAGRRRPSGLPGLGAELAEEWSLELESPYAGGNCPQVMRASRAGEPVVLKVTFQDAETRPEPDALRLGDGDGRCACWRSTSDEAPCCSNGWSTGRRSATSRTVTRLTPPRAGWSGDLGAGHSLATTSATRPTWRGIRPAGQRRAGPWPASPSTDRWSTPRCSPHGCCCQPRPPMSPSWSTSTFISATCWRSSASRGSSSTPSPWWANRRSTAVTSWPTCSRASRRRSTGSRRSRW
jgi:hypothetical protein